jgi:Transposase DDE domain group 1
MATACIAQATFRFHRNSKPVIASFDLPDTSSDGGAVLLKALDTRLELTQRLAAAIHDRRQLGKVQHLLLDLLRQRVFGLACGYADCNDAARLGDDPIHKLLLERDPLTGPALGSQPTLSRFENAIRRADLLRLADTLTEVVIAAQRRRLGRRARLITIDLDQTDDPTHGQQQFALFNGYYDTACYLPLLATLAFNDEPHQYLVAAMLRSGTSPTSRGVRPLLVRLLPKLRAAFPRARLRVRLDAGFADPQLLAFFETEGLEYLVALPRNARLDKRVRRLLGRARMLWQATGQRVPLFGETRYAAKTWPHKRRVIMKAEVVTYPGRTPKPNPRFIVTNLRRQSPALVYALYCQRGDAENRLKELQQGLALDRTSCSRFLANQFRLLLTAAAYVLFQELQRRARGTGCAAAQVTTLRDRLIKLAVWVRRSVRRVVLHFPRAFPWLSTWQRLAARLGAT